MSGGRRGRLKVFLGYEGGFGALERMLDEGERRKRRGQAVATVDSADEAKELFTHPPAMCLLTDLARHTRGEVEALLDAGISVIATVDLQRVDRPLLDLADDIEIVDTPSGDSQLRERALVLAAEVVDRQLLRYLEENGLSQTYGVQERILCCITPRSNASLMIGRGHAQAERFHGELMVAYVRQHGLSASDEETLERNLEAARMAKAHIEVLEGEDVVHAILEFAKLKRVTQIFIGHTQRTGFWDRFRSNPVERLIVESGDIDIRIFPQK